MFEKDEDYRKARKESKDKITKVISVWCAREETIHDVGFQQGANFGYNKANEWHYVKDGDLPKDEKDMLMSEQLILLTKMKGTDNLNLSIGQYNFSTQEFSYPRFVGLTDVIAWKEIVLPKESE